MRYPRTVMTLACLWGLASAPAAALNLGSFNIGGGAPQGTGATVAGWPAQTFPGGILATRSGVAADASWVARTINQALLKTGSVLSSGQQQQIAAQSKLLTAQTRDFEAIMNALFTKQRESRKNSLFGPLSQPLGTCGGPTLGSGIATARMTGTELTTKLQAAEGQYNASFSLPSQYVQRLDKQTPPDLSANAILPPSGSIQSLKAARNYVDNVLNPKPPIKLPSKDKGSPQGQRYTADRNVYQARMSLERSAVRQILVMNTPTAPLGQWAKLAWQAMGRTGQPTGVVNGRISPLALEQLQISLREGNPAWYTHVTTHENTVGLLRELVLMRAISLKMQMQRLRLAMHASLINAERNAETIDHVGRGKLNQDRNAAIAAGG